MLQSSKMFYSKHKHSPKQNKQKKETVKSVMTWVKNHLRIIRLPISIGTSKKVQWVRREVKLVEVMLESHKRNLIEFYLQKQSKLVIKTVSQLSSSWNKLLIKLYSNLQTFSDCLISSRIHCMQMILKQLKTVKAKLMIDLHMKNLFWLPF